MKTNQEMVRYIDSFSVVQRTSDGYFDGTELLRQWNNVEGNPRRQMSKFLESDNTSEFLKALAEDESHRAKMLIGENQLLIKVKGRIEKGGGIKGMLISMCDCACEDEISEIVSSNDEIRKLRDALNKYLES